MATLFSKLFGREQRTLKFGARLIIHELTDVPLNDNIIFVKWKDKENESGTTNSCIVDDHIVRWNQEFQLEVNLVVDEETDVLQPHLLRLSVRREIKAGKKFERLGVVQVNVAEYAGTKSWTRTYLLQKSNENSVLKITLAMNQLSGDPLFKVPPAENVMPERIIAETAFLPLEQPTPKPRESIDEIKRRSYHTGHRRAPSVNLGDERIQLDLMRPSIADVVNEIVSEQLRQDGVVNPLESTMAPTPPSSNGSVPLVVSPSAESVLTISPPQTQQPPKVIITGLPPASPLMSKTVSSPSVGAINRSAFSSAQALRTLTPAKTGAASGTSSPLGHHSPKSIASSVMEASLQRRSISVGVLTPPIIPAPK